MTDDSKIRLGRLTVELLAMHRQDGDRCGGCGEAWPCLTRVAAPGHYRPGGAVPNWREALEVVARHTEHDGHCTACGEEWVCWTRREADVELRVHDEATAPWA